MQAEDVKEKGANSAFEARNLIARCAHAQTPPPETYALNLKP
jgi:hypothetical protein